MHYFTFADKDTTLYQASSSLNAGLDEVLEIRKDISDTGATINASRILIKFDLSYISSSIVAGTIPVPSTAGSRYYLNLYDAHPSGLATSQVLYAHPVSGSWTMGDGHSYDNPVTTEGASWSYRHGKILGKLWLSGPTGSVSSSGGQWYSGSGYEASQSFTHTAFNNMCVYITIYYTNTTVSL